jgi:hypothetical protein
MRDYRPHRALAVLDGKAQIVDEFQRWIDVVIDEPKPGDEIKQFSIVPDSHHCTFTTRDGVGRKVYGPITRALRPSGRPYFIINTEAR